MRSKKVSSGLPLFSALPYSPRDLLTFSRFSTVSSRYPFLARSDLHRPCFDMSRSSTPLAAACDAPPERRLCGVKNFPLVASGRPSSRKFSRLLRWRYLRSNLSARLIIKYKCFEVMVFENFLTSILFKAIFEVSLRLKKWIN